jgi:hypothetical protein
MDLDAAGVFEQSALPSLTVGLLTQKGGPEPAF